MDQGRNTHPELQPALAQQSTSSISPKIFTAHLSYHNWIQATNSKNCMKICSKKIFCTICQKTLTPVRLASLRIHLESKRHNDKMKAVRSTNPSTTSTSSHPSSREAVSVSGGGSALRTDYFERDLAMALLATRIRWNKLDNPHFHQFLVKYCNRKHPFPGGEALRKKQLPLLRDQDLQCTKTSLGSSNLWVSVHKFLDIRKRVIFFVSMGPLDETKPVPGRLIACRPQESPQETLNWFLDNELSKLWPRLKRQEIYSRIKFLLTKKSEEMLELGYQLQHHSPNLIHLTCFVDVIHAFLQEIRHNYPTLEQLIGLLTSSFLARLQGTSRSGITDVLSQMDQLRASILRLEHDLASEITTLFDDIISFRIGLVQLISVARSMSESKPNKTPETASIAAQIDTCLKYVPMFIDEKKSENIKRAFNEQLRNYSSADTEKMVIYEHNVRLNMQLKSTSVPQDNIGMATSSPVTPAAL